MDQTLITRIVEAALLAASQPLTLAQLHALFPEDEPAPADAVEQAIEALTAACAGRGVELVELASGFRYQVQADVHPWVARLWTERQTRYTRATLETLALIAYRQPITRGEIEQVRGVAVSSNIIRALEEREWIRVVGHRDVPGKPALFGTTRVFLDYFGLKRLDELPPLSELRDLGELEPQFQFDGASPAHGSIAAGGLGQLPAAESQSDEPMAGGGILDAASADQADPADAAHPASLPSQVEERDEAPGDADGTSSDTDEGPTAEGADAPDASVPSTTRNATNNSVDTTTEAVDPQTTEHSTNTDDASLVSSELQK